MVAADKPLYVLAKQIQWQWPDEYGKNKFVLICGELHIKMAALRSIGTSLVDCGWTGCLVEAGSASSGTAEPFLTVSSVTRTRQAHQITACTSSLFKPRKAVYVQDYSGASLKFILSFEDWCNQRRLEKPQF